MSRRCSYSRETRETLVEVELDIDTAGEIEVSTPIPFFNHILETMLYYMNTTAKVKILDKKPCDDHHVVEDTAIAIGEALAKCLENKAGIKRFSHTVVPMDDALVLVAVDVSGRGGGYVELGLERLSIGGLSTENVEHFIETLANRSRITIHVLKLRGKNTHHIIEASFKGLGIVLHDATRIVCRDVRSLKGSL
ncbi:MAG: imidazoleglycerol-phosphate dehydratase [Desulfurococcaceae archaeon]|nr:imidazoleglycerol-phosphate dehydratase [Desulfurococcaceae archaeon]